MRIIKKLDIYILKNYLLLFAGTFFICLFIFIMQFIWQYIDDLVGKGLSWDVLLEFFFYASLTLVPMSLPLAVLLASLISFGNMGEKLELRCGNDFIAKMLDKPDILEVVSRKASAQLGRQIRVSVVDLSAKPAVSPRMEELMKFGRAHSDVIHIKEQK